MKKIYTDYIGGKMSQKNPKLFISYSWSSPEHEEWVLLLATELRESGVDVVLDKWDLKEGHDSFAFMEKMVTDPEIKKVAIICDKTYSEKANKRKGGVGTETQIITPEIYQKEDQNKFVAVVAERNEDGQAYLPVYYKSRIYIDLSESDLYSTNFEQLLRWIYDKPLFVKPKLGKKPSFLSNDNPIVLGTTSKFKRALEAVRNNKEYTKGAIAEYFDTLVNNLEDFRLSKTKGEFDDAVIENLEKFIPYRNEAIELILAIAQYRDTQETRQQIHRFFENLIPYLYKPESVTSYREWDFDNFKFFIHELFLYAISSFIKYECFDSVAYLLRNHYYIERNSDYGRNVIIAFSLFSNDLISLKHRNSRLKLRRLSLHADLLEQRSKTSGLTFKQLIQTDFILYIRNCLDCIREEKYQDWWPETLLYIERHSGAFEIFARAQSIEYFDTIKEIFGISSKDDLVPLFNLYKENKLRVPSWQFTSFDPAILLGFEKLATRP
ncbi:MAG: TIR domain-containing protein [Tissierellales bacterium]|nr:TIR domain-containing protein [Tissierellales bacterium]